VSQETTQDLTEEGVGMAGHAPVELEEAVMSQSGICLSVFHTENKNSPNKRMQLFNACRKLFGITYVVAIVYKRREKES
jgi:hypothetical protein